MASSDISGADYYGQLRGSNNGTSAATNVAAVWSGNTSAWITAGLLNATATNAAILNSAGADTYFQPGYGSNPWVIWFSSISAGGSSDATLYTPATGGKQRYFTGVGGANVTDNNPMEPSGGNFTYTLTGIMLPNSGSTFDLLLKTNTLRAQYSPATGNLAVTATISNEPSITAYTETDPSSTITLTDTRVTMAATPQNADHFVYRDLGANNINGFNIPFTANFTNKTSDTNNNALFGVTNTVQDYSGLAATDCSLVIGAQSTFTRVQLTRGFGVAGDWHDVSANTTVYGRIIRVDGSDTVNAYIYSDAIMQNLLDTLTVSGYGAGTRYRYRMASANWNNGDASKKVTGYFEFPTTVDLTKTGISDIEHSSIVIAGTSSNFTIQVDGGAAAVGPAVYPTDNTSNWYIGGFIYASGFEVKIGGTVKGSWDLTNTYRATFTDDSGNGNTMTPSFRTTSSNANVSVELVSFQAVDVSQASGETVTTWGEIITSAPSAPSTAYTEDDRPGIFFEPIVHTLWAFTGMPDSVFWYAWAFSIIIGTGVLIYYMFASKAKDAIVIKIIWKGALIIFFALPGLNIFGAYVFLYYAFFSFGLIVISRSYGW